MTENHIIVGASDSIMMVGPKRVVSIEETIKGGTCRSCSQTLNAGEPRIKVAYPNVIVQYNLRTGSPSFYMHPACYETNPVDFWRIGPSAYKETIPINGFALLPENDIIGYGEFPELQHRFDKSRSLYLAQKRHESQVINITVDPSEELLNRETDATWSTSSTSQNPPLDQDLIHCEASAAEPQTLQDSESAKQIDLHASLSVQAIINHSSEEKSNEDMTPFKAIDSEQRGLVNHNVLQQLLRLHNQVLS